MILGLTGGIASGKSTVAGIFRDLGAVVVSADVLARKVVLPGSSVLAEIVSVFGERVLDDRGHLNRKVLGELIFADAEARIILNRITHPAIAGMADQEFKRHLKTGVPLIVYDAPLLFEAKAEGQVDKVLLVTIDPAQQMVRLIARDGIGRQQALARIASQMPQEAKAAKADYIIDNSGTLEETRRKVRELMARLGTHPAGVPRTPRCVE